MQWNRAGLVRKAQALKVAIGCGIRSPIAEGRQPAIASNAGIKSQPYSIAYCASKAGVVHLTRCLADEYLKRGVRANCVAPGGMETPLQQAFMEFPEGVDWKKMRKVISPLGNSQPEEIANVVAFIASDECRYMTGSIVSIDGGITV